MVMTLHNYRLSCLPATFLRDGRVCEDCLGRLPWRGVMHRCYRQSVPASASLALSLAAHRAIGTFDRVTLFLAASDFVRSKHIEGGLPPERVITKPNFAWPGIRRDGPGDYFLYLGRLSAEKDIATLLKTWTSTRAQLIVVGEGPDAEQLRRAAPRNVEFRSTVMPSEVPALVSRARALLVPSLAYEAAPRTILEGYACGVPVIANAVGALPELVIDGASGVLVPARAPSELAAAIERLSDDAESVRLGEGAWRLWRSAYTPEIGLKSLEDAYRLALRAIESNDSPSAEPASR